MMRKICISIAAIVLFCLPALAARKTIPDGNGSLTYSDINNLHNANYQELYNALNRWATATSYTADLSGVIHGGAIYICTSSHTAGSTTEPGIGASWNTVWKFWGAALYEPLKGADDNYVTDAEKTAIGNLPANTTTSLAAKEDSLSCSDNDIKKWISGSWQCAADNEGAGGGDSDAIHDNVAGEIVLITEKASPVSGDHLIIEDSEDSNNKKRVQVGNLPGGGSGAPTDAQYVVTATNGSLTNEVLLQIAIESLAALDLSSLAVTLDDTNALDIDITYETLNTNGDVGTGAGQLAIGNHSHTAAEVGLGNVDNTSDATKLSAVGTLLNKDLSSGTNTFPSSLSSAIADSGDIRFFVLDDCSIATGMATGDICFEY